MQSYRPFEQASSSNLDENAYLAANPDVRRAGMSAKEHFETHGQREGRLQYDRAWLRAMEDYRARKFSRYRHTLDLPDGLEATTFPIVVGDRHFDLQDYAHESSNPGFGPFDAEIEEHPDKLFVDLGCGLREHMYENCMYIEVYPSGSADLIVEPTCLYPLKSESIDGIGCFAVLEHTRRPWQVVSEIHRILKVGGKAFIDWPFLQPIHGFPSHYFNATREGLKSLFEDNAFHVAFCGTGAHETPAYTVRWILGEMLRRLPSALRDDVSNMRVGDLAGLDPLSAKWQSLLASLPDSAISEFACGNWLLAEKQS